MNSPPYLRVLSSARDLGLAHLPEIARREHAAVGLTYDDCLTYLRDHLHFYLGPREWPGLRLFYDHACQLNLAPPGVELNCRHSQQPGPNLVPEPYPNAAVGPNREQVCSRLMKIVCHDSQHSRQSGCRRAPHADEGLALLQSHDLAALGRAADAVTRRLHPEPIRTYNIDRNINYTNVCTAVCDFCAFYRKPKARRRLRPAARGAAAEDPGDGRARRRSDPDAGRPASRLQARVVRRAAARHQVALPAGQHPRLQPAGDPPLHEDQQAAAAHGAGAAEGGRAGQPARRRGGDSGRSRPQGDHARQGADRRLAERASRLARAGRREHAPR